MDGRLHYLDNASTVFPKPEAVMRAAVAFCASAGVSPGRGTFDLALEAASMLDGCRKKVSELFGGPSPDRVVFGYNATDALNLAIFGLLHGGGHVVSTRLEHNSVLRPVAHCVDDLGARATLVPFDRRGYVDPDDIRRAIEKDTRLVVVNHASNVLGTVQPIAEIGAVCRQAGVPLCVDVAQSAGVVPIDMEAMSIDVLAFTGHKSLMGPTGIGGLVVGDGVEIAHTRAGGTGVESARRRHLDDYPFRLEYGTPNMMGIAGLARGIDLIVEHGGERAIHAREMALARVLHAALSATEGVTLYCAESLEDRTPVFAFNLEGMDPAQVGARLDVDFDVACRTGLHCAPLVHESLGTAPDGAVRLSIGPLTTLADVEAAAEGIAALAKEVRG
ncbi:MAG: aminotransferase class V-fold PLP-dependent enzyme [Deltaproteobacteria bacterium]|nr:aminotransferase class V-fold PLP-dependent enzyme [Deltaproteobacteria bacterium]